MVPPARTGRERGSQRTRKRERTRDGTSETIISEVRSSVGSCANKPQRPPSRAELMSCALSNYIALGRSRLTAHGCGAPSCAHVRCGRGPERALETGGSIEATTPPKTPRLTRGRTCRHGGGGQSRRQSVAISVAISVATSVRKQVTAACHCVHPHTAQLYLSLGHRLSHRLGHRLGPGHRFSLGLFAP